MANQTRNWGTIVTTRQKDKRSKFVELVEKRMTNALHDIKLIGNLSNRSAYEYSEKDVRLIVKTLEEAVADLRQRFKNPASTGRSEFRISDR